MHAQKRRSKLPFGCDPLAILLVVAALFVGMLAMLGQATAQTSDPTQGLFYTQAGQPASAIGDANGTLRIKTFSRGATTPDEVISIPLSILDLAAKLLPKSVERELAAEGITLEEFAQLARNPEVQGTIMEMLDNKSGERTLIVIDREPAS